MPAYPETVSNPISFDELVAQTAATGTPDPGFAKPAAPVTPPPAPAAPAAAPAPVDYDHLYQSAGLQYGVDPNLLRALVQTESSGNPNAVSPTGVRGLTQMTKETSKNLGFPNARTKVEEAIPAAAKLLRQNFDRYGDAQAAIAAYNAGNDPSKWDPNYVKKIADYYQLYSNPPAGDQINAGAPVEQPQAPAASPPPTPVSFDHLGATPAPVKPEAKGKPAEAQPTKPEDIFKSNQDYALPGVKSYQTPLQPADEQKFEQWVKQNKIPWKDSPTADYDMRGYWKAMQAGDPDAKTTINPNDKLPHFPDTWKTPYHQSFSGDSIYADPDNAPKWNDLDQLVAPNGVIKFDERNPKNVGTISFDAIPAPASQSWAGELGAAAKGGVADAYKDLAESSNALNKKVTRLAHSNADYAQPLSLSDLKDPKLLAAKSVYMISNGAPVIASGIAGGYIGAGIGAEGGAAIGTGVGAVAGGVGAAPGAAVGAVGGSVVGGIGGAAVAAGAASAAQSLAPYFKQALQQNPNDPDAALQQALNMSRANGVFSAVGWAAFSYAPFKSFVKDSLLQAFGVQPVIAIHQKEAENLISGRPLGEGVDQAAGSAIVGTAIPMIGMHAVGAANQVARSATSKAGYSALDATRKAWEAYKNRTRNPDEIVPPTKTEPQGPSAQPGAAPPPPEGPIIEGTVNPPGGGEPPPAAGETAAEPPREPPQGPAAPAAEAPVPATTPEPKSDIDAQIKALIDRDNPKDAVFIASGNESAIPDRLPSRVHQVPRAEGTLLTTDIEKAHSFANAKTMTDEHLARILGYPETKEEAINSGHPVVVQGVDPEGNVPFETLSSPEGVPAATEVAQAHTPDGHVQVLTPEDAQKRRDELVKQEQAATPPAEAKPPTQVATSRAQFEQDLKDNREAITPDGHKYEIVKTVAATDPSRDRWALRVTNPYGASVVANEQHPSVDAAIAHGVSEYNRFYPQQAPGSEGGGGAEPAPAPTMQVPTEAAPTERPRDQDGNHVFEKGDRVLITGNGKFGGRRGEIIEHHALTMSPLVGGAGAHTIHTYRVKTDNGAEDSVSAKEMVPEPAGDRPHTIPDPLVDGHHQPIQVLRGHIASTKRSIAQAREKIADARTQKDRDAWRRILEDQQKRLSNLQGEVIRWHGMNPGAAESEGAAAFGSPPDQVHEEEKPASGEYGTAGVGEPSQDPRFKPIVKGRHGKTGKDLWTVPTVERIEPKEEYTRINNIARKYGTGYSYWDKNGATPGFEFPSLERAQQFLRDVAPKQSLVTPPKAPENGPPLSPREKFENTLRTTGSARDGDLRIIKVEPVTIGGYEGYVVKINENGIVTTLGGVAHQGLWTHDQALQRAFKEASFPGETPHTLTYGTPEAPNVPELGRAIADHFLAGKGFDTIVHGRNMVAGLLGAPAIDRMDALAKHAEEAIEVGVVQAAHKIIMSDEAANVPMSETFAKLVDLYKRQPRLGMRTSTSVENQAYSTPAPLAYVASKLAGIGPDTSSVYEPTAGNGMLLIGVPPDAAILANELNPDRLVNLKATRPGAYVTDNDASHFEPWRQTEVVIANPPFGAVFKDGKRVMWHFDDLPTKEIDQAISLQALKTMMDHGKAVLIIGGKKGDDASRLEDYRAAAQIHFFKKLYDEYNVVSHFTVEGRLYERQGAAWPVDVIVIHGRGKSSLRLPSAVVPRMLKSWDEVGGQIYDRVDAAGKLPDSGDGDRRPEGGRPESGNVPRPTGDANRPDGGQGGPGVRPGAVAPSGGSRAPGAAGEAGGSGGLAGGEQQRPVRAGGNGSASGEGAVEGQPHAGEGVGSGGPPRGIPIDAVSPELSADEIGSIFDNLLHGPKDEVTPPSEHENQRNPDRPDPNNVDQYHADDGEYGWQDLGRGDHYYYSVRTFREPTSTGHVEIVQIRALDRGFRLTDVYTERKIHSNALGGFTIDGPRVHYFINRDSLPAGHKTENQREKIQDREIAEIMAERAGHDSTENPAPPSLPAPEQRPKRPRRPSGGSGGGGNPSPSPKPKDDRPTIDVAKSAAQNANAAFNDAVSGIRGILDDILRDESGTLNFDHDPKARERYEKLAGMFKSAVENMGAATRDVQELVRRLIEHFRNVAKWADTEIAKLRPYLIKFIQDVQAGIIKLFEKNRVERSNKEVETEFQVRYEPKSDAAYQVGTLVPRNMQTAMRNALEDLEGRVGDIDHYVADKLGYSVADINGTPEKSGYFSGEQIDALALAIDNVERSAGFIIGDQCVAGETLIYDPINDTHTPIEDLARSGLPHYVLSLTERGFEPKIATRTFLKGIADLYEVTLDDGRRILVTAQHRFLTPDGWSSIDQGILEGTWLATAEASDTNCLAIHGEDDPSCSKKPQDFLDRYSEDFHQYDEPPLFGLDSDRVYAPSQGDVLEHNRSWSRSGDQGISLEYSLRALDAGRLSKRNSSPSATHGHVWSEDPICASAGQSPERTPQIFGQFGLLSIGRNREDAPVLRGIQTLLGDDSSPILGEACLRDDGHTDTLTLEKCRIFERETILSLQRDIHLESGSERLSTSERTVFASRHYSGWRRIVRVQFARRAEFYDMYVPGPENYVAEGIVNHNTGVGKGRFVAGMLRYAQQQGMIPIFVTKDPGLYSDLVRDLRDIGMPDQSDRIFVTNTDLRGDKALPLSDREGDTLKSMTKGPHAAAIEQMIATGKMPDGYDMLFTTYSQLQYAAQGAMYPRQNAILQLAPNAMFVLDESHEAGGTGDQKINATTGAIIPGRADFVREMIRNGRGTVYSSATYAKNPTVMSLYYKTDLSRAVDNIEDLEQLISSGGVPLQQVIANMLVEAGQYARRERSFEGVSMNMDILPTNIDAANNASAAMRAIYGVDVDYMEDARELFGQWLQGQGTAVAGNNGQAVGQAAPQGVGFGNVMHNVVSQMFLALKTQAVIDKAIALHKAGEKVIIAVSNTNAAIVDDYVKEKNIRLGDLLKIDFNEILNRYLYRLRRVTTTDSRRVRTYHYMTDSQIEEFGGPGALDAYKDVERYLKGLNLHGMSASPLDQIIDQLRAAGIPTGEITGREMTIENGKLTPRKATAAAKKIVMNDFNAGRLDALVINRSGSTGFSLHATGKPDNDGKPRHMIVLQPDPNIDVFMQMLGRIHRTGQIRLPSYTIGVSDLALEKRAAAILMKKMASLNANTTASKRSAVSLDNVTDFMNQYGDHVVKDFILENPDLAQQLGFQNIAINSNPDGLTAKFTGRIALLPPAHVEQIYEQLESTYNEYIENLDRMGTNALEAKFLDLDAQTMTRQILQPRRGETASPFDDAAYLETASVRKLGKPYTPEEIETHIKAALGDYPNGAAMVRDQVRRYQDQIRIVSSVADGYVSEARQRFEAERQKMLTEEGDTPETRAKIERARAATNTDVDRTRAVEGRQLAVLRRVIGFVNRVGEPGTAVSIAMPNDITFFGKTLGIDFSRLGANLTALSRVTIKFAIADPGKEMRVPLSQILREDEGHPDNPVRVSNTNPSYVRGLFRAGDTDAREPRQIITGNLASGFATFQRGQIVMYSDSDGNSRQGILLPRTFNVEEALRNRPVVFKDGHQVAQFLTEPSSVTRSVTSSDGIVRISYSPGGEFVIAVRSQGGRPYYLNLAARQALGGDFIRPGSAQVYRGTVRGAQNLENVLRAWRDNLGAEFETTLDRDAARRITGESIELQDAPPEGGGPVSMMRSGADTGEVQRGLPKNWQQAKTRMPKKGADAILARLRMQAGIDNDRFVGTRAARAATREEIAEIERFIDFLGEQMVEDVGVSIKARGPENVHGQFDRWNRIVTIYRAAINTGDLTRTMLHELWHSQERALPLEDRTAIQREWVRARNGWLKKNPWARAFLDDNGEFKDAITGKEAQEFLALHSPDGVAGPAMKHVAVMDGGNRIAIRWGAGKGGNYRFKNKEEYFAETLTDAHMRERDFEDARARSIWGHIRTIWHRMVSGIKRLFGRGASDRIYQGFKEKRYNHNRANRTDWGMHFSLGEPEPEKSDALLTQGRIDREISISDYPRTGESKASIAWIDPKEFLRATTGDVYSADVVAKEAGDLDRDRLARESQTPFLSIRDGKIIGHEGRHRMAALAKAGIKRVPVIIDHRSEGRAVRAPQNQMDLTPQYVGKKPIVLKSVIPLASAHRHLIEDEFGANGRNAKTGGVQFMKTGPAPDTESPAFKKWFEDSKVANTDGSPKRVYHGTVTWEQDGKSHGIFNEFDRMASTKGPGRKESIDNVGSWFSETPDRETGAGMYAGKEGAIYPVYLSIKNPWRPRDFESVRRIMQKLSGGDPDDKNLPSRVSVGPLRHWLIENGYDGIYLHQDLDHKGQSPTWIALHPEQIKSAIGNSGAFDRDNPDIRYMTSGTPANDGEFHPLGKENRVVVKPIENPDDPKIAAMLKQANEMTSRLFPGANVAPVQSVKNLEVGRAVSAMHIPYVEDLDGSIIPHLIVWALDSEYGMDRMIRHEGIHYLRDAGMLTPQDWDTLSKAAIAGKWLDNHDIRERYPHLSEEDQIEEAIAEQFATWKDNSSEAKDTPKPVATFFQKVRLLLNRLAAIAHKFFGAKATADDIFHDIESGKVGRRPYRSAFDGAFEPKYMAERPNDEEGMNEDVDDAGPADDEIPEEGSLMAETAKMIADQLRDAPPGTLNRAIEEMEPSNSFLNRYKNLNALEHLSIFPDTLAKVDSLFATFWNRWKDREQTANRLMAAGRQTIAPTFLKLDGAERDRVYAALELDRIFQNWREDKGQPIHVHNTSVNYARMSKRGDKFDLTDRETRAYFELRQKYSNDWSNVMEGTARKMGWIRPWSPHMQDNLEEIFAAATEASTPAARRLYGRIHELLAGMELQRRLPYIPMMRFGDYFIAVKPKLREPGGMSETHWFELVERPAWKDIVGGTTIEGQVPDYARGRLAALREQYSDPEEYEIIHGYLVNTPEALRDLDIPAIEKLLMMTESGVLRRVAQEAKNEGESSAHAREVAKKKWERLYEDVMDALYDEMYEQLKTGFKKHAQVVPGYSEDFDRVTGSYMHWNARHVANLLHQEEIDRAYDHIMDKHPHPQTQQYTMRWRRFQEDPTNLLGTVARGASQLGFLYTMAGNVSSMLPFALHTPLFGHANLSVGIGVEKSGKALYGALAEAYAHMGIDLTHGLHVAADKVGKTLEERKFLRKMIDDGVIHSAMRDEMSALNDRQAELWGKSARFIKRAFDIASSNISGIDQANRLGFALAAFRLANNPADFEAIDHAWQKNQRWLDMSRQFGRSPEALARFLMSEGTFEWGRMNTPEAARNWFGRMFFFLHGFQTRAISSSFKLATMGPAGRAALTFLLSGIVLTAGVQGVYFIQDLENSMGWLSKMIFGKDPMLAARMNAMLASAFGKVGAEMIMRGPASTTLGIDIASRVGFGDIIGREFESEANLLGTVPSILWNRGLAIHDRLKTHQSWEAVAGEFLPAGIGRNQLDAAAMLREGVKGRHGNLVMGRQEITAGDVAARALGFTPNSLERRYESNHFQHEVEHRGRGSAPRNPFPKPHQSIFDPDK